MHPLPPCDREPFLNTASLTEWKRLISSMDDAWLVSLCLQYCALLEETFVLCMVGLPGEGASAFMFGGANLN